MYLHVVCCGKRQRCVGLLLTCGKSPLKRWELPRVTGGVFTSVTSAALGITTHVAAWRDGRLLRSSTVRPLVHKVDFLADIETCWQMAAAGLRSSAPVWRGVAGRAGFSQTPPAEMGLVHPRLKVPRWGGSCWLSRLLSFSWQSNYLLNCDPISKGLRRRLLVGHHIRSVLRGTPKDAQRIEVEQKWGKQRKMLTYETSRTDWCLKEDENTELVLRFG